MPAALAADFQTHSHTHTSTKILPFLLWLSYRRVLFSSVSCCCRLPVSCSPFAHMFFIRYLVCINVCVCMRVCVNVLSAEYFDNSNFLNVQQLRRGDFFLFRCSASPTRRRFLQLLLFASLSFHFIHCVHSFSISFIIFITSASSSSNMTFVFIALRRRMRAFLCVVKCKESSTSKESSCCLVLIVIKSWHLKYLKRALIGFQLKWDQL